MFAHGVFAADERKIRLVNIAVHPLFTLVSSGLQGRLHTFADVRRCLLGGSIAGYAFYESKVSAGRGDVRQALLIANVAAAMSCNTAAGVHPLARLGFTLGPARIDFATPFAANDETPVQVTLSAYETYSLVEMRRRSDDIGFRDGLIGFHKRTAYEGDGRSFGGFTYGIFPGTQYGTPISTWNHEVIHVIQAMQSDSLEPRPCAWLQRCRKPRRMIAFEFGAISAFNDGVVHLQEYPDRWTEIEATRLAEGRPPR